MSLPSGHWLDASSLHGHSQVTSQFAMLLDTIDRISTSAALIKKVTQEPEYDGPGAFSRALFNRDTQAVIRDVDDSELGLFTLENTSVAPDALASEPHVTMAKVTEATPLRKQRVRTRSQSGETPAYDPEVYAEAALRYLHK